jgi:hypothetical protein
MNRKAYRVVPDLAVFVFVGRITVNPPIVLLLEGMTTVEVEEDATEVVVSTLAIIMMVAHPYQTRLQPQTDERLQEQMTPRTYQH